MVFATNIHDVSAEKAAQAPSRAAAKTRDPRLDFFRGIAMCIILIAHIPGNWAGRWIPARFGFSDAAEMFVFCSGMASAIAFGAVFANRGWLLGTARVAFRCWQVYWAHVGLFLALAATTVVMTRLHLTDVDYIRELNLYTFFGAPETRVVQLLTLQYVPNFFDILPMYLVILAMMPVVVAIHRLSPSAAIAFVLVVWLGAQERLWDWLGWGFGSFEFPSTHAREIEWFFNPFGWQLLFFTGFALMRGWLPVPPVRRDLIALAGAFVIFALATGSPRIHDLLDTPNWSFFWSWPDWAKIGTSKTDFGLLRYLHILSLAYLAFCLVGPGGRRLMPPEGKRYTMPWRVALNAILRIGQQSLAIFIVSMWLSRVFGMAIDVMGSSYSTMWIVNLTGIALLVVAAYAIGWFKSHPWRAHKIKQAEA